MAHDVVSFLDIDILCKVVDNFGDIGVVYRLARSLSGRSDPPRLRLVVDDLRAFAALDPAIDPEADVQTRHGWEVYRWSCGPNGAAAVGAGSGNVAGGVLPAVNPEATAAFRARRPRVVLECFACGRPDWLEDIIFDASRETCLLVDLEHLTAEKYAEDFHRMPSLTRSAFVRKAIFLPGFAAETGGLIKDDSFERARVRAVGDEGRRALKRELLAAHGRGVTAAAPFADGRDNANCSDMADGRFWVLIFSYERDYARIVADLASFASQVPILAVAAAGKSGDCFAKAWAEARSPFPLLELPFLPQERWDAFVVASDFAIVRGEDSWARAALAGRPFLWQAYPQEGRHQLVKVAAFLETLRPYFAAGDAGAWQAADETAAPGAGIFSALSDLYTSFNDRDRDSPAETGTERLLPLLLRYKELQPAFRAFSEALAGREDLASNLLTFLGEIV